MTQVAIPIYVPRTSPQGTLVNAAPVAEAAASAAQVNAPMVQLAKNLGACLDGLTQIELKQQESRRESLYADVKAEAIKRTFELNESLADDTDYATHKERFAAGIEEINTYARDALKDHPALFSRFNQEVGVYTANQAYDARRRAVKGINEQNVVGLERRIVESQGQYSLNSANNEIILSSLMADIDRLEKSGALSAREAEACRTSVQSGYNKAIVSRHIDKDPGAVMQAIDQVRGTASAAGGVANAPGGTAKIPGRTAKVPGGAASTADFVAKAESGTLGSMAIGCDSNGGTSYGRFQISSKVGTFDTFINWLDKKGHKDAAQSLRAAGPANTGSKTGATPDAWKSLVEQGKITPAMEEEFIRDTHVTPALAGVPPEARKAIEGNEALAAALFSTAVQHGSGAKKLITAAWNQTGGDSAAFIESLYEIRKTQFSSSTEKERGAVRARLDREKSMIQDALGGGTEQPANQPLGQTVETQPGQPANQPANQAQRQPAADPAASPAQGQAAANQPGQSANQPANQAQRQPAADPELIRGLTAMNLDELNQYYSRAQEKQQKRNNERTMISSTLAESVNPLIIHCSTFGDWSRAEQSAQQLTELGRPEEAAQLGKAQKISQDTQALLSAMGDAPFAERKVALNNKYTEMMKASPQDATLIQHVFAGLGNNLQQQQEHYAKNSAAIAEAWLVKQNINEKDTRDAASIKRNMAVQAWMGRGIPGFTPSIPLNQKEMALLSRINDRNIPAEEKLPALADMAVTCGELWPQVLQQHNISAGVAAAVRLQVDDPKDPTGVARLMLSAALLDESEVPASGLTNADVQILLGSSEYMRFNDKVMKVFAGNPKFAAAYSDIQHLVTRMVKIKGPGVLKDLAAAYNFVDHDNMLLRLPNGKNINTDHVVAGLKAIRNDLKTAHFAPNGEALWSSDNTASAAQRKADAQAALRKAEA